MVDYQYKLHSYTGGLDTKVREHIYKRYSRLIPNSQEEYDSNTCLTVPYESEVETFLEEHQQSFRFEGDKYHAFTYVPYAFPAITGLPRISIETMRPYGKVAFFSRDRYMDFVFAPPDCEIRRLINYPLKRMGGPQGSIVGTYGSGKSNLMNLLIACYLAKSNVRNFMFNDRRFEARNLAGHGYLDLKPLEFHPFQIDVMIPQGYQFKRGNPLWESRKNVTKYEWTSIIDILEHMAPHHLTVIYDECFTEEGKIKLWIDIMKRLAEETSPSKHYMFYHHELSSLIPEVPTKNIYGLTREAANVALNLRKDRIGMFTTFHMPSEVFYRISQKFGYVLFKKPVNRRNMSLPEEDAKAFSIQKVNISKGGRWMTHTIGMFPESPDEYRLVPHEYQWTYPKLTPIDDQITELIDEYLHDPLNVEIMKLRAQGLSYQQIADRVEISKSAVYERSKRLGITGKEIL